MEILGQANADKKAELAISCLETWKTGAQDIGVGNPCVLHTRPARPERPKLAHPAHMPKRKLGSTKGRIALIHSFAHIELNAIDLAFDMIVRFVGTIPEANRSDFVGDWVLVGAEEGLHFKLLQNRLRQLGSEYGDLLAHDGLWEAAEQTSNDLLARLAVVPLVLEARGLDVSPATISKLEKVGDRETARILNIIYNDEIGHVAKGMKWFSLVAKDRKLDPEASFHAAVRTNYKGLIKPPFNHDAREKAQLLPNFYLPLSI